jgi:predicted SAM-dependent methyltransferase
MDGSYIQFGCGITAPEGWRNFDAGPAFWLQKYFPFSKSILIRRGYPEYPVRNMEYGDVIKGLPVPPGSATAVYCSHVLEHLALEEFRRSIRNVWTYLVSGGTFRLVVPDLEHLINEYLRNPAPEAASSLMREVGGEQSMRYGVRSLPKVFFGLSRHLWMYDYKSMAQELSVAGFGEIRRAFYNDSQDPRFKEVESLCRWENCLGIECRKP